MFIVEVGSVLTTFLFFRDLGRVELRDELVLRIRRRCSCGSRCSFANFAEAMAEGRGKAQAEALRKTPSRDHRVRTATRRRARRDAFEQAAGR